MNETLKTNSSGVGWRSLLGTAGGESGLVGGGILGIGGGSGTLGGSLLVESNFGLLVLSGWERVG